MPSPWGEGAPKGRMRGPHQKVEHVLLMRDCSPHQSQTSFQLLCDSFPPKGKPLGVLPHQNNRTINYNLESLSYLFLKIFLPTAKNTAKQMAKVMAHSMAYTFRKPPDLPFLTARISATTARAISAGVSPPRSRPMGVWTVFRISGSMPASESLPKMAAIF